ncbi:YdcH family protein [Halodurantibacterium flavum]|uniref:YdcH family protein n=1 Tax=Halodurantibacterium flavum TaxID=1382802 RepID=A0ABW4S8E0_9RHOB
MNAPMELKSEDVLRIELEVFRSEHRDLDAAIQALETTPAPDALQLRRLKKKKLQLRDRIARIEDLLTPDIIA